LLTARPQGYRDAPLTQAHVLEVLPFHANQVEEFIQNWYLANKITLSGGKDDPGVRQDAERKAQDLLHRLQDRPRLKELTVNPLLLTMITNVHNYRGVLPEKRVELYAEICDVLLGHWRQAKGVNDRLTAPQRREVLQPLAEIMMTRRLRGIPTQEAMDVIHPQLTQIGVAEHEIPGFLSDVQSSSGLLLETESEMWSFAHLTFQEYLCAAIGAKPER
jgi:predicted NACHT family NTPase